MNEHNNKPLSDLACEIRGASSLLTILQSVVKPNEDALKGESVLSAETVECAFYSIEAILDRVAEDLSNREASELKK